MTHEQRAQHFVDNLMHQTHVKYQKQQLAKDAASTGANALPCPEQRGCREARRKPQPVQLHWFTRLRPNFWKAYFETLQYMAK